MKKSALLAASLAGLLAWGPSAGAYTHHQKWLTTHVTMRASGGSFPVGSSYRSALGTIVARFNANPSDFWFTQRYDDSSCSFMNTQSEVWFTDDSDYDPAVTHWWIDIFTNRTVEADVVFYNGEAYTTSMNKTSLIPFGGSSRPFQTTALHEYGHVAGLGHESDEYNIMGDDWTHIHCNGSTARSYLGEDAADGLIHLYTTEDDRDSQDVSVSLFKYLGRNGEYSTHTKCVMYSAGGTVLPSTGFNGQRRYAVNNGQQVRFEYTLENSGESTKTGRIGFYLSTNSTITTADRLVATRTFSLTRDDVVTQYSTLTIPSDLISGTTYYLGAIIDDDGLIVETDESNAMYHIIKVN